ncbi:unnamed protein product [Mesocestoides corti]|uniref:Uncharacterized protein n=1 Tax=Mesocestoides corti TaxID=53468 RepID=A0A0R3U3U8_MESCO|nr:unnamed protein product [Mesocestoides corti]
MQNQLSFASNPPPTVVSPSLVFLRSHSPPSTSLPKVGASSSPHFTPTKRDSLFLCESDFPPEPDHDVSGDCVAAEAANKGVLIAEAMCIPKSSVSRSRLPFQTPELLQPPIPSAAGVENVPVATSLPAQMDYLLSGHGANPFSDDSLSSSPSKPGAASSGGGSRMAASKWKKSAKTRRRTEAKHKQPVANDEEQLVREARQITPTKKHRHQRKKSSGEKSVSGEANSTGGPTTPPPAHRSDFDEEDPTTEGWAAEIDKESTS